MIAKAKAIAHGKQAINYALREGKMGKFIASNLISSEKPNEILQEFEMMQCYNVTMTGAKTSSFVLKSASRHKTKRN